MCTKNFYGPRTLEAFGNGFFGQIGGALRKKYLEAFGNA